MRMRMKQRRFVLRLTNLPGERNFAWPFFDIVKERFIWLLGRTYLVCAATTEQRKMNLDIN